jgi:hypothetical protein
MTSAPHSIVHAREYPRPYLGMQASTRLVPGNTDIREHSMVSTQNLQD